MDYKKAGVDIKKADLFVMWLKRNLKTSKKNLSPLGSYTSVFDGKFPKMKQPLLVSSTDGVGTKLKWSVLMKKEDLIAYDLVGMTVNDILCSGAKPLFLLDYFSSSKIKMPQVKRFFSSLIKACKKAKVDLVGGEMAEMPGVYKGNDFDCCAFVLGVVEKKDLLPKKNKIKKNDLLLAISSSGPHSNGYSLLRKLYKDKKTIKKLLKPTSLYTSVCLELMQKVKPKAFCHVTGSGMDNILRVLPSGLKAKIKPYTFPKIFLDIQKKSKLSRKKMLQTFNCGAGMILVIDSKKLSLSEKIIKKHSFKSFILGHLEKTNKKPFWYLG